MKINLTKVTSFCTLLLTLMVILSASVPTAQAAGAWSYTGSLNINRSYHTATLLPDGRVLVAGGNSGGENEIYDPTTGQWTFTGSLTTARTSHTATLLPNGKVLVVGGYANGYAKSAELYDPATEQWTLTGSLTTARYDHTATLLSNGKVLVAGGYTDSAELYDPAAGSWSVTNKMTTTRYMHTATLLPNGKVLVAGGNTNIAELYDPTTGQWSITGNLTVSRVGHTATLLPNGKVLVAGGSSSRTTAELYNPDTGSWSATGNLTASHYAHTATLLPNGKVLVASGNTTELYDSATGQWSATGNLNIGRSFHRTTLLLNGKVLVAGGGSSIKTELYESATGDWNITGNLIMTRSFHSATLLSDGKVLVVGGQNGSSGTLKSAELYNPATGTWKATGSMTNVRVNHTAILLSNGKVLVVGGDNIKSTELYDPTTGQWTMGGNTVNNYFGKHTTTLLPNGKVLVVLGNSAELYDPTTNTWNSPGNLTTARSSHTATLLPNGKVLVAGGTSNSAELYSPDTGSWSITGKMTVARGGHGAVLLPNGKVLVVGGDSGNTSELYDPATGTWSATGSLNNSHTSPTTTLLPNGQVLIVGIGAGSYNAELYDPTSGLWSDTGNLNKPRNGHTATLLQNGQVLAAGGSNGSTYITPAELYTVATPVITPTPTVTSTPTNIPTATATKTVTPIPPTNTPTSTPTNTPTATPIPPTITPIPPTPTNTPIPPTSTNTPIPPTATNTPIPTPTPLVAPPDTYEADNSCAEAKAITTDGLAQSHTFHVSGDEDWVKFEGTAGTTYLVDARVPDDSLADVVLVMYDKCNGTATPNDSFNPEIHIQFKAPSTGTYYLQLTDGNDNGGANVAYQLSIRQLGDVPSPGVLVLVGGRLRANDSLQRNIYNVTNNVYRLFTNQGYPPERITYLANDLKLDPDNDVTTQDVDNLASRTTLEQAILQAADKVGPDRALTLYMMDHGNEDKFYLNGGLQTVDPTELSGWLDTLEAAAPGVKVNVIIDACYSGSFIKGTKRLGKAGRVIIASTTDQTSAYASKAQGAIFSDSFIQGLGQKWSLYDSFMEGQTVAKTWYPQQKAWLDANGNGTPNEAADFSLAQQRGFAIAGTFDPPMPPYIATANGPAQIKNGQGELQALVKDDVGATALDVWAVIYKPSYITPTTSEELVADVENLPTIKLNGPDTNHVYHGLYEGFNETGTYRLVIYAKDEEGLLSRPRELTVTIGGVKVYLPLIVK